MLLLKQNRSWVSLAPALACLNDCQMRERIYSDGTMNKQNTSAQFPMFFFVL